MTAVSSQTLAHYESRAVEFWEGTRDHDVRQNIEALLRHLRGTPPFRILDFGCGPGRDLRAIRALGHEPLRVAALGRAVLDGLARAGVAGWAGAAIADRAAVLINFS